MGKDVLMPRYIVLGLSLLATACFTSIGSAQATPLRDVLALPSLEQPDKEKQPGKEKPGKDKGKKGPEKIEPKTDVFAQSLLPPAEAPRAYNPHMMGDFFGLYVRTLITVTGTQTATFTQRAPGGGAPAPGGFVTTTV